MCVCKEGRERAGDGATFREASGLDLRYLCCDGIGKAWIEQLGEVLSSNGACCILFCVVNINTNMFSMSFFHYSISPTRSVACSKFSR